MFPMLSVRLSCVSKGLTTGAWSHLCQKGLVTNIEKMNKGSYAHRNWKRWYNSFKQDCDSTHSSKTVRIVCQNIRQQCFGTCQRPKLLLHSNKYRLFSVRNNYTQTESEKKKDIVLYVLSFVIFMGGVAYAAVPFYKMFCRVSISASFMLSRDTHLFFFFTYMYIHVLWYLGFDFQQ